MAIEISFVATYGSGQELLFNATRLIIRLTTAAITLAILPALACSAKARCNSFGSERYSTLDGVENGGQASRSVGPDMANVILTPSCPVALIGVVHEVKLQRRDLGSFDVFYSQINKMGQPYDVHVFATVSDSTLTRDFKRILVQPGPTTGLVKDHRYYIGIRKHAGALSTVILGTTVDPTVLRRQVVVDGAYFYNIKGQQPNANDAYEMLVILG